MQSEVVWTLRMQGPQFLLYKPVVQEAVEKLLAEKDACARRQS